MFFSYVSDKEGYETSCTYNVFATRGIPILRDKLTFPTSLIRTMGNLIKTKIKYIPMTGNCRRRLALKREISRIDDGGIPGEINRYNEFQSSERLRKNGGKVSSRLFSYTYDMSSESLRPRDNSVNFFSKTDGLMDVQPPL